VKWDVCMCLGVSSATFRTAPDKHGHCADADRSTARVHALLSYFSTFTSYLRLIFHNIHWGVSLFCCSLPYATLRCASFYLIFTIAHFAVLCRPPPLSICLRRCLRHITKPPPPDLYAFALFMEYSYGLSLTPDIHTHTPSLWQPRVTMPVCASRPWAHSSTRRLSPSTPAP
jgi:hypothetical protein